jgi:hypothetical protein
MVLVSNSGRGTYTRHGHKLRGLDDEDLYSQNEQGLVSDDDECYEKVVCLS